MQSPAAGQERVFPATAASALHVSDGVALAGMVAWLLYVVDAAVCKLPIEPLASVPKGPRAPEGAARSPPLSRTVSRLSLTTTSQLASWANASRARQ